MEPQEAEEGQECTKERCLKRRREVGDLRGQVDDLCNSEEGLTKAKEELKAAVRYLERKVNLQKEDIAKLEKHEERFNEEFSLLEETYHACLQRLDNEKQENNHLESQMKYLLEINEGHLAKIQRLEDFAIIKPAETPEGGDKPPCSDIENVKQRQPSKHCYVLPESEEDNWSIKSASFIDARGECMEDILANEFGSDAGPDEMELDSYSRTAGTPTNSQPSRQAIIDVTEAKDLAGAARTQAMTPESKDKDCHRALKTKYSTYTRLSRIHVHANRTELINTLSVMVRRDDQAPHTSTTVLIIDKSRAGCPPTKVVVDKLLADAIPSTNPGECILLKNFKVSWSREIYLESHTKSELCIWRSIDDYESIGQSLVFGLDESAEMERLRHWWQSQRDARGGRQPPFC